MKDGVRAPKGTKKLVAYHQGFKAENLSALEGRQVIW